MNKNNELTWEDRIASIVSRNPMIKAVDIVDTLSTQTYLSARWGKTDACRTIQDMANTGKLVREWNEQGEVLYRVV